MEICVDCAIAHANDDFTGMTEAREAEVKTGMERTGHLVLVDDEYGSNEAYFSWDACDACKDRHGGDRLLAVSLN